ncbi:hypothetical protein WJX84_010134 [Apatococcus fuscideae]|uniref:DNA-directed RNA polymerase subunit n=1 Tax=Apatococcus fuscideae TaxID=2026836 RepID=A0AAW1S584_9CHLO
MAVVVNKEVTTTEVAAVSFGFFRYDEVRKLSVKPVSSPLLYDTTGRPVDNGLYDQGMGPMEPSDVCVTCGLVYGHCPGHFGHVELAGPVYNPLTFTSLYKLLRCTCLHCFNVKMADAEMAKFTEKLKRLSCGDLAGAAAMSTRRLTKAEEEEEEDLAQDLGDGIGELGGSPDMDWSPDSSQENLDPNRRMWRSRKSRRNKLETSALSEAMSELISDFLARMPTLQCQNCKAHNPSIIREGYSRFFLGLLDAKKLAANEFNSVPIAQDLLGVQTSETPNTEFEKAITERLARDAAKAGASVPGELDSVPGASSTLKKRGRMLTAREVVEIVRRVWPRGASMLSPVFACDAPGLLGGAPSLPVGAALDVFFLKAVSVPPNKFRPPSVMNGVPFEHPQNVAYGKIIQINNDLRSLGQHRAQEGGDEVEAVMTDLRRSITLMLGLQNAVNALLDSTTADGSATATPGVRQGLEKKEGLFRKNMMGKRVNFAARSVISPDPYIATGEIGIPPYFALRLSFPERVTPWNVGHLREMVIRGANELGGAVAVEDEVGRLVSLAPLSTQKRIAIGKALLTRDQAGQTGNKGAGGDRARHMGAGPGKTVYRHVQNGDLMLTNRQPTLHKPGLMAHRVRILQGERTIRMHYANCNTFNADFDGDEINLHLPQDHLGRTEGYGLVHADRQFLLPTSGTPARGLIQDHVGAGVLLTKRDTFLTRAEYGQLVWIGCGPHTNDEEIAFNEDVDVPVPAVLRPRELFTGKQVISTIIGQVLKGLPPLTLKHGSKVPADYFGGRAAGESEVHLFENTLLTGCLDKAVYGNFGIIHGVQELYGPETAGVMLSAFSRVLTGYLQMRGFTCGIDDLLLVKAAETERAAIVATAEAAALKASADLVGHTAPPDLDSDTKGSWEAKERELRTALAVRYSSNPKTGATHDMKSSGALHPLSSSIVKACLPGGQQKPFPHNCLSLMTVSGAKGSLVNFSQISCLLGQQELEGRRVPRMASGRTLPCFAPYDAGARSCGFIGDRFLTGLRPQEFYFHCMAGREGLVDTTVKTSRSGYLQRCLVKNLESLRVHYDYSVRNDTDGCVKYPDIQCC